MCSATFIAFSVLPIHAAAQNLHPESTLLQVLSFGVASSKNGMQAERHPDDFTFEKSATAALPKTIGRLVGPVNVSHGDTWQTVFARLQLPPATWVDNLRLSERFDWPHSPLVGSKVWIRFSEQLMPLALYYSPYSRQMKRALTVSGKIVVEEAGRQISLPKPAENRGNAPLYAPVGSVGLPETISDQMSEIFAGVVDFHFDLRGDYQGLVLFEMLKQPNSTMLPGRILAAHLTTRSGNFAAYWFAEKNGGRGVYVAADGSAVQRNLLQSPLVFSRVTSGYEIRRFHPILHYWRAHNGIDYAAPVGTPVRATSSGVVEFAGVRGDYGNCVVIRHPDGLTSWYGHLSHISIQVMQGRRVGQGEVLGEVGMSGLATGPHLHYEIRREDRPFDPATVIANKVADPAFDQQQRIRFDHLLAWYEEKIEASRHIIAVK